MIYIVEDDTSIRELVLYALEKENMEGRGFEEGTSFFKAMEKEKPDLILLDIMLEGMDGLEILKRLKQNRSTADIPVILLTAKTSEFDVLHGLDSGAEDYIKKPFSILELLARIRVQLRKSPEQDEIYRYKEISLDKRRHRVEVDGEEVTLTYKEFQLLLYFLQNPGIVLMRDQMMERIWGFDYAGETRTVDVHIASLRQKLKDAGRHILTVRNVGYKLGEEA